MSARSTSDRVSGSRNVVKERGGCAESSRRNDLRGEIVTSRRDLTIPKVGGQACSSGFLCCASSLNHLLAKRLKNPPVGGGKKKKQTFLHRRKYLKSVTHTGRLWWVWTDKARVVICQLWQIIHAILRHFFSEAPLSELSTRCTILCSSLC